jgi:serine/threonine-protein kinase
VTWLTNEAVERLRDVAVLPQLPADRYALLRPLGRGGMGTVHAARDARLGREVAIKVSNASTPDSDLEIRLSQESGVLARLEHPGIVPVHDAGTLGDGRAFYVMKLIRGETLTDHARHLPGEAAKLAVFERVVDTVAFAHANGVVHRDVKPSNVMVGRFGEVLVLDWGAAKLVGDADLSAAGLRLGTPGFMAPEQRSGDAAGTGPGADVFSLGALLFWLLTGHAPPADRRGSEVASALRALTPVPPRRLRAVVLKCLSADARDRYRDAGALSEELARYRAGLPVDAHRESWLERLARRADRHRALIILVLAYLVMRALFAFWR